MKAKILRTDLGIEDGVDKMRVEIRVDTDIETFKKILNLQKHGEIDVRLRESQ